MHCVREAVEGKVEVGVGVALNVAYGHLQAHRDHNAQGGPPSERRHFALTHKDTRAMMCCPNQGDPQFSWTKKLSTILSFSKPSKIESSN